MKKKEVDNSNLKKNVLRIVGARENNLKNITVSIPKSTVTVITGPSGSGKSSLAFDVIHTEGQRRFLGGVSSFARSVLDIGSKPDVDRIEGISPTIAIDQKSVMGSPRSTVGTLSEIYDYLRAIFVGGGSVHCPQCKKELQKKSVHEMTKEIIKECLDQGICISAFVKKNEKETLAFQLERWKRLGVKKVFIKDEEILLSEISFSDWNDIESLEFSLDQFFLKKDFLDNERLAQSLEKAFLEGDGLALVRCGKKIFHFRRQWYCEKCFIRIPDFTAGHFSFNHPEGACRECSGLGERLILDPDLAITSQRLTLEEGALGHLTRFLGKRSASNSFFNTLEKFASRHSIDIKIPLGALSSIEKKKLFYSTKEEKSSYEGIVSFLGRKHKESTSESMRLELEKCMQCKVCDVCGGRRLRKESLAVTYAGKNIAEWSEVSLEDFHQECLEVVRKNKDTKEFFYLGLHTLFKELIVRAKTLCEVGLGYLSLHRTTLTLSGGESQRIRLAVQLISELSGVLYVLDEPSRGLHPRDTKRLIQTFVSLRDRGNTVLVVEHDRDIITHADWLVDIGPGAGKEGGEILFSGNLKQASQTKTLTTEYLFGKRKISSGKHRGGEGRWIVVRGAKQHNLKNITVRIPLGLMTVITGVSGSGKSTFVHSILSRALRQHFFRSKKKPGKYSSLTGVKYLDKVITITQAPIGKSSRSNVATYSGIFSSIRILFSQTKQAKDRLYDAGRFSFNLKGGRCEFCQGEGMKKIEMYLLPDQYIQCEVCQGNRYSKETLEIRYKGMNIADVLNMSVEYAKVFFADQPLIAEKLSVLERVGLGYLRLGQGAPDLSGGEAQRIKLATELSRKSTGKTLYILDEPTVGLHFEDTRKLLEILDDLVDRGNSVLMVEHNTDVIRYADHIIDFGPEGGEKGGNIIFEGTPRELKKCSQSITGAFL